MKKKSLEVLYKELKDCGNRLVEIADALLDSCSSATEGKQEAKQDVSLDAICEQMGRVPDWIDGLLLRADGYETQFYKKD